MASTEPLVGKKAKTGKTIEENRAAVERHEAQDKAAFGENWRVERKEWLMDVPEWFEAWNLKVDEKDIDTAITAITKQSGKWIKNKLNKEGADMEDHTVGPALKIAFRVNTILWLFFLAFPWVCGYLMSCPIQDTKTKGLALVGYPLWLWVPFMLLVYGLLRMEAIACKSSIVTQVMTSGIPMGNKLRYKGFLYTMLAISLFYHFDIFTNGVYMARVYKTETCNADSGDYKKVSSMSIELIWHQTMLHSAAAKTFLSYIPYWGWAVVAWLSLLLQPIYAYCYAYPRSPELQPPKNKNDEEDGTADMHPEEKPVDYLTRPSGTDCAQYQVVFRGDQQHGRALQAISESARMNSVYFLDPAYMHHQVKTWQPGEVHREMQRCNVRFFIFVIETIFPPNLQATFLCMEKALAGTSDYIIFVSVLVSFITGLIYVRGELTTVFNFHKLVMKQKEKFDVWEDEHGASRELQFKAKAAVKKAHRSKVICILLAMFGLFMLVQAVVKAYMGAFVCECGMWNNKGFPLSKGCVSIDAFKDFGVKTACGVTF